MEARELVEVARGAARAAVAVHRRHLGSLRVENWAEKGTSDFVTHVDREAEAAAVSHIRERCPGHAFLAEEEAGDSAASAAADAGADWLWVVDPLDGTTNYLHRYPVYAASIAVVRRGEPVAGAVISGATGEEWTAWRGGGAYLGGERIRVSRLDRLPLALIGTGFPFKALDLLPRYLQQFDAVLRRTSGIRRAGSAALDLCHVASGYFDGFWELHLSPWDVAAGTLLVREAGGVVTTLDGEPNVLRVGSVLAGNPTIHRLLGGVVREAGND